MKKILILLSFTAFFLFGCNDMLDRPQLTAWDDENFWTSESQLRLYANGFYDHAFYGYSTAAAAHTGYQFSDDYMNEAAQTPFTSIVPNSRGNNETALQWTSIYGGRDWNFLWIRKANIMIDRIENKMGNILTPDQKNHWLGVARFFRALDYASLVSTFGDVPYYDREIGSAELDELYKPRTPRNQVMDAIHDDFVFAMENIRGTATTAKAELTPLVVASFVSRWALFEGTWQKYHHNDQARVQKFLNLAVRAAEVVINSYGTNASRFNASFRSLFVSTEANTLNEVILYRRYSQDKSLTHSIGSSCNMVDGRWYGPNISLVMAFICNDGTDWQTSPENGFDPALDNQYFDMVNLIKTRDSRFEASFYKHPTRRSQPSNLYVTKFVARHALAYKEPGASTTGPPIQWSGSANTNGYPVLRYSEVLLNWIEAKYERGDNITQTDIDNSINLIRRRPLDPEAIAAGVRQTAALNISLLPDSPDRGDVPQLLWEIRRERRMEFAFEYSRLQDLRRWRKLEYMDNIENPKTLWGAWSKLTDIRDIPDNNLASLRGSIGVVDMEGNKTVFDGSNTALEGFFYRVAANASPRPPFLNVFNVNPYLAPVGRNQRIDYQNKGYVLEQTTGWPNEI
ncbi:MAG: RagB/SusD family nutrient uptake outer membrane protein [Bacteroidales bacterium]|nr:RagB/SusD family nutrient uptake outer membrane protein [Bacteroidales bacterium]